MPKRTNPFQSVVLALQRTLHPNATVTESTFLRDRISGERREVDVVVEAYVGPYSLILGFECTAGARPADVGWVEEMHGKHQSLSTDKLFLVSQHGFTHRAVLKAESHNHVPISLASAESCDWTAVVAKERRVFLLELRAAVLPFIGEAFKGEPPTLNARLRRAACGLDVSVGAVADTLLAHPTIAASAIDVSMVSEGKGAIVEFDPAPGVTAFEHGRENISVDRVSFAIVFNASRREIRLTSGVIGDRAVAFGGTTNGSRHTHVTIVEVPGGTPNLTVHEHGCGGEPQYRDLSGRSDTDLQPLPDATMRLLLSGYER